MLKPATGGGRRRSRATDAALNALAAMLEPDIAPLDEDQIESKVRDVCVAARADHVPVEAVLIQLHRTTEGRHPQPTGNSRKRMRSAVRCLISTYYSDGQ
jgi:hypothetical protein